MQDEWVIKRRLSRTTKDGYLVVTAGLHKLGDQEPYFSVTAELWQSAGWYRNGQNGRCRACGCLHDEILRAFPKLRPLVDLHLSTADGVPMHAEADSLYFARNGDRDKAAATLRVPENELPAELTADYVNAQRPRWKAEAEAGVALLEAIPA